MDGSVPEALRRMGDSLDIESGGTRARAAVLTTVSTARADRVHPHVFYFHISNVPALTASNSQIEPRMLSGLSLRLCIVWRRPH